MSAGQTVHVRVNDAASGQPTPCRIRFESGGCSFAPFGRLETFSVEPGTDAGGQVRVGEHNFSYIDGTCEVRLPPGAIAVEVCKGPEFTPLRRVISLAPGQIALRLTVARWTNWRSRGWVSGDTRVLFIGPHAALLEAAAEDVAVVNLLACQVNPGADRPTATISNILAFSGQAPALERPGHLVVVNTLNGHPSLGSLALLNCHRAVYPLLLGVEGAPAWALADLCDQCHRKKTGLVVWTDPGFERAAPGGLQGEPLADLILGKVDAFETRFFEAFEPRRLADWYTLLAAGLRVPLVGGSGKDSNAVALGRVRTYAYLGEGKELNYGDWIEAVRAGRTFVTNGPLLSLSVGGEGPGAIFTVEQGQRLALRAEAQSALPFQCLELLVNGAVAAVADAAAEGMLVVVEAEWPAERGAWIAARCRGDRLREDGQYVFAQTSPVYIEVRGRPFVSETSVVQSLVQCIDESAGWVARAYHGETEPQRQHLLSLFSSARERLLRGTSPDG